MNDRSENRAEQAESFTVPAMRGAAMNLRANAAAQLAEAEIKAREYVQAAQRRRAAMLASADEIDAAADRVAAEREATSRPPVPAEAPAVGTVAPCPDPGCPVPVAWDGLGWTHAGATDCGADLSGYVPQPAALTTQQDGGEA